MTVADASGRDRQLEHGLENLQPLAGLMTGPEWDDGTAGTFKLFWPIARERPAVLARMGEAAAATDPKYQRACDTFLIITDTGNQHAFRPKSGVAQKLFIGTIFDILANDPEGSGALENAISVALN